MLRPRVIGVCGGSGSGKTTLVSRLEKALPSGLIRVLGMDHYYHDLTALTPDERHRRNFDHPDAVDVELFSQHLRSLIAGQPILRPNYDFATHTRRRIADEVVPMPILVVDGILALHWPELRGVYDLSVYVDVDDDVRLLRRVKRDIVERGRTIESVASQYLASVKPMHDTYVAPQKVDCDVVVSWMNYNERAVSMLAGIALTWNKSS